MELGINNAIKEGNGNTIIYTALIAAAIANALPTPADSIYFTRINKLERKFDDGLITAEELEWRVAFEYYIWTAGYYAILFLGIYSFGGQYKTSSRILLSLIAGGLVIGAVQKNIEVDKSIQERKSKQVSNG
jgi:hypothetical protein